MTLPIKICIVKEVRQTVIQTDWLQNRGRRIEQHIQI